MVAEDGLTTSIQQAETKHFGLPDAATCRRARLSHDARFDGVFFIAVKTTGIFCRPVCRVTPPKEENVRYLASAAEAFAQGFRPCLRCRPETAPTSAAWLGARAIAKRVLRSINQGALTSLSVTDLAEKMGISERYLRSLCQQYAGASPNQLELARRSLLAKHLLFDSTLSITDIAFAAGYQSVRRFNEHWKQQFGLPPSQVRKQGRSQQALIRRNKSQGFELFISLPADYDASALLAFFRLRQLPLVEEVGDNYYRRCIRLPQGQVSEFEVTFCHKPERLQLTLEFQALAYVSDIVALVKRLFDTEAPLAKILFDLRQDTFLNQALEQYRVNDIRLPGTVTPFEAAVRAIVGQQISVKAAITILKRILSRLWQVTDVESESLRPFPQPEDFRDFNFDGLGLPQSRINTLNAVVEKFCRTPELFELNADPQLRNEALLSIKGIGPWTVRYLEMRAYALPDAFPAGDLIVRQSYSQLVGAEKIISERQLNEISLAWQPWRAYVTILLWQYHGMNQEN